jgi:hypothetical protein
VCKLEAETGPCEAALKRYFFNHRTGKCEQFIYGGCLGNDNNFLTEKECFTTCGTTVQPIEEDVCKLEAEPGPCRASFQRYFFNHRTGQCETFTYGGCHGNDNNFLMRG